MDILAVKKRLMMFLDNDEEKVKLYLDTYGTDLSMPKIKEIRTLVPDRLIEVEVGEDPLYKIKLQCPVCKARDIDCYELKAKSQIMQFDPFMMPIYSGAGDYRGVNFPLYSVTVCPKCYLASPDKKDFNVWNRTRNTYVKSTLGQSVISELIETMGARQSLVEDFKSSDNPLHIPRTPQAAINSYLLALERVEIEVLFNFNFSTYKKANYWLKIALIQRQFDLPFEESLKNARDTFKVSYLKTDFPSPELEYQGTYVLSALELYFGNDKLCREYQSSLERTKTELKNTNSPNLKLCLKWIDNSKRLWEDRNRSDLWDLPQ